MSVRAFVSRWGPGMQGDDQLGSAQSVESGPSCKTAEPETGDEYRPFTTDMGWLYLVLAFAISPPSVARPSGVRLSR